MAKRRPDRITKNTETRSNNNYIYTHWKSTNTNGPAFRTGINNNKNGFFSGFWAFTIKHRRAAYARDRVSRANTEKFSTGRVCVEKVKIRKTEIKIKKKIRYFITTFSWRRHERRWRRRRRHCASVVFPNRSRGSYQKKKKIVFRVTSRRRAPASVRSHTNYY